MSHFNGLTPAEAERLALLLEELGEVQQVIGKILRHGYESRHPAGGSTNRELLEEELGDLAHAQDRMLNAGDVSADCIAGHAESKAERVGRYLHHQPLAEQDGSA